MPTIPEAPAARLSDRSLSCITGAGDKAKPCIEFRDRRVAAAELGGDLELVTNHHGQRFLIDA